MSEQPLVSIIIPTYNRAHIIGETLDSVLAQTYPNWECIVVDDGSTDSTAEVMKLYCTKDARFQYCKRTENHLPGGNGARNYGLEISNGEYIQWFDSDDIMIQNKLNTQMGILMSNIKFCCCFCTGKRLNRTTGETKLLKKAFNLDLFEQIALNVSELMTPSFLIKKSFLVKNDLFFDEEIKRGQEAEFLLRLTQLIKSNEVNFVDECLFLYITSEDSISNNDKNYISSYKWSQSKFFLDVLKFSKKGNYKDVFIKRYKKVIQLYFMAIRNQDYKTGDYILSRLKNILPKQKRKICTQLLILRRLYQILPFPLYTIGRFYQNKKIL
ncbi:MAG: glycosyltransferase family 2 protein [Winogradskyella arenosi]